MENIYENRDAILLQRRSLPQPDDIIVQENYESLTSAEIDKNEEYGFPSARLPTLDERKLEDVPYEDDLYREMYLSVSVSEIGDEGSIKTVSDDQEMYDDIKSSDKAEIIKAPAPIAKVSGREKASLGTTELKKQLNGLEPDKLFKTIQRQPMLSLTSEKSIETYRKIHKAQTKPEYPRYCVALVLFNFIFNIFLAIAVVLQIVHVFPPQLHTHKESETEINQLKNEIASLKSNLTFASTMQEKLQEKLQLKLDIVTACPPGWYLFNSSCYFAVRKHKLQFFQAEKACLQLNASVTSIHSVEENDFIVSRFMKCPWSNSDPLYIGLYYDKLLNEAKYSFRWRDNSTVNYLGNDKSKNIPQDKQCTFINNNGVWVPTRCLSKQNYICRAVSPHRSSCAVN